MLAADTMYENWRALWGKWGELGDGSGQKAVHPLVCHMLDVGAVAEVLWEHTLGAPMCSGFASALGLPSGASARRWLACLAALHDLGKTSPAFQLKRQSPSALAAWGFSVAGDRGSDASWHHGRVTAATLGPLLEAHGVPRASARHLAQVVGGHHGTFPTDLMKADGNPAVGGASWSAAREALVAAVLDAFVPGAPPTAVPADAWSLALAGFVTVADWIGSNDVYFPYAATLATLGHEPSDLAAYLARARQQAHAAISHMSWATPPVDGRARTFHDLFGFTPRPLQEVAESVAAEVAGKGLVVVEAPMGEGKTEAALLLAERWISQHALRGAFLGLPTQATSNQLFGRVRAFLEERYPHAGVNTLLLHGHAALSAELALLRDAADRLSVRGVALDEAGGAALPSVLAAEWFTYRKRGLLAPFGVGTVDQALMAALKTRHVFVRLFGLAGKVVVIDEVHAYDAYMSSLLERLLTWLGALGSPVVLLSATLPRTRREGLERAYAAGAGWSALPEPVTTSYPRLTWRSAESAGGQHVATSSAANKHVALEWLPPAGENGVPAALLPYLQAALADGGCALVLCNTVNAVQAHARALRALWPGDADDGAPLVDVLHARFLHADRALREQRSLGRFGRPGGTVVDDDGAPHPVRRPGRVVLAASQVVEQSLDLDFDLLVSQMAPVDLLLQRVGRLHRHQRPERPGPVRQPRLCVVAPTLDERGIPHWDGGTQAVYHPHVLLRSWLALRERDGLRVPDDVEALIETVYGDAGPPAGLSPELAAHWRNTERDLAAARAAETQQAADRYLRQPDTDGFLTELTGQTLEEDAPELHPALQALTRLAEPTVTVVALWGAPDQAFADADRTQPVDPRRRPTLDVTAQLLRHACSLGDRRVVAALRDAPPPPGWAASPLLRHTRAVFFDTNQRATLGPSGPVLVLDPHLGIVIHTAEEGPVP